MPDFKTHDSGLFVPEDKEVESKKRVSERITLAIEVTKEVLEAFPSLIENESLVTAIYQSAVQNLDV